MKVPYNGIQYHWIPLQQESLAASLDKDILPDLKENFNGGPLTIPATIKDPENITFATSQLYGLS